MTRKHHFPRRLIAVCLLLTLSLSLLCSCGILRRITSYFGNSDPEQSTPFRFYGITVSLPFGFVRDTTASTDTAAVFERGWYKEVIIVNVSSIGTADEAGLDRYIGLIAESGGQSERTSFLSRSAVRSSFTKNGVLCREILFLYQDCFYAIALDGGTEEVFTLLIGSVSLTGSGTDA